eukprot:GFUD01001097.1.p1 GENE.GFUD01001097.1~~GFUD01001097.1.p1  ORF type:complete len:570 (-),score=89.29 GFUD01001097.1:101-1810(-)
MAVSSRLSMRHLRSSQASDSMTSTSSILDQSRGTSSRAIRHSEAVTAYNVAPKQRLNLVDVALGPKRDTGTSRNSYRFIENSKDRKRRLWKEKQKKRAEQSKEPTIHFSGWMYLPDLILEHIFKFLSYKARLNASMTCCMWQRVFWNTSIWSHLVVRGTTLCEYRYVIARKDYEATVDTMRVSAALNSIGMKLKCLSFMPHENLHNIVTFQEVVCRWCNVNRKKLPNIKCFVYVFPCDFAKKRNEVEIYGTGGMILQNMKDLLTCLPGLERLELVDLQLDGLDGEHALDEVSEVCCFSLKTLKIVNITRIPFSMLAVSSFVNLRCLIISPHNLGDDLVECISCMPKLRNVHIVSNAYSESVPTPVDYRIWKQCRKSHPRLRVHLVTEGKHKKELTYQTKAPVKSLVYDTPYTRANQFAINLAVELYKTDLEVYCHQGLPRFTRSRSFHDRADSAYLYLVRQCPYLHTLMIRERISTSTVLLLAYTGKNLRYFHLRRNAIILKCDWPKSPDWSDEFYAWLKRSSRSYADMEKEVSQILGFRWYALNDKQFKLTHVNLNFQYYYEGFEEAY